jgi:predicted transcriptional regulator
MDKLAILVNRLKKIGIEVELFGNSPWVYLDEVCGKKVKEQYLANHGFTIAFYPTIQGKDFEITNIGEIFKILRKYARTEIN